MYDVCEALFLRVFPAHSRCNPVDESWWTCLFKQGCQASEYTANIWLCCSTSWRGRHIGTQWSFCCVLVIKRCTMGSAERCRSQQTSRQYKIYSQRDAATMISFYLVNDNNYLPVFFFIVLIKITFKYREKNGKKLRFIKPSYINFVVLKSVSDF